MITGKSIVSYSHAATDYISLAEAKRQLNILTDDTTFDNELTQFIKAAIDYLSNHLGYSIRKAVVKTGYDKLLGNQLRIASRVLSVTNVKFVDENETEQTLAYTHKQYDSDIVRLFISGDEITTLTKHETKYVVNYVEGFEPQSATGVNESTKFPDILKACGLWLVSQYFENRQSVSFNASATEIPFMFHDAIFPYKIMQIT